MNINASFKPVQNSKVADILGKYEDFGYLVR